MKPHSTPSKPSCSCCSRVVDWSRGRAGQTPCDRRDDGRRRAISLVADAEQRAKANLKFDDANRFDWHYVPRPGQRKGLPLKEMTAAQRQAAHKLLATALSAKGMKQAARS